MSEVPESESLHDKIRADVVALNEANPQPEADCFYCGDVATDLDHTIPHSFVRFKGAPRQYSSDVVPACKDCNALLTNRIHGSMSERLTYLCQRVTERSEKILAMPDWDADELNEMSRKLRNDIKKHLLKKLITKSRIKTLDLNAAIARSLEA